MRYPTVISIQIINMKYHQTFTNNNKIWDKSGKKGKEKQCYPPPINLLHALSQIDH